MPQLLDPPLAGAETANDVAIPGAIAAGPANDAASPGPMVDDGATINAINQRIFDTSLDLILVVDKRGTFLRVSPSAATILGYDPSELIGRNAREILYPPDLDNTRNEMRLARRNLGTRNFECHYVHKKGRIVSLWWIGVWSESEGQYFFIGRDVTDRNETDRMLRESEARLALAVDLSGIGLAGSSNPTEPARPTEQFNRIYGFPPDKSEITVGEFLRTIHPRDRDRAAAEMLEVIRHGGIYRGEFRIRRADDQEERWIRAATQTVRHADGRSDRFIGVHLDITDLKETAQLLEAAMGAAHLGTWATDATSEDYLDARMTLSEEAYRICGHTPETFGNRVGTFWRMIHPEDREQFVEKRQHALARDDGYHAEFRIVRPDSTQRWVHLRAGIIRDAAGKPTKFTGVVQDITDQRTLEDRLRQAQRMDAIGHLTGGMAHDFNNLLGVVIANLDLLKDSGPLTADQEELAGEALAAAISGADLTRRLLAFARQQRLLAERITINELVRNIVGLLARTLGEHVPITVDLGADLWPVRVDPAQLESAIVNLATNARDAMPKGGRLMIATANRVLDADYAAAHSELAPGDYVMIEVSDTGTGIPPEVIDRVFEPFFTTKETGKGNGLGLSMIFGFIKQSGGHVNVYSEVGKGTTFRLYLPRDTSAAAGTVRKEVAPAAVGGNETVLVVEDNDGIRRAVRRQLSQLGYRVVEAENAAAALQVLAAEPVVLLFTDVVMPGEMDGVDLAHQALARWPALKVILTSGFPEGRVNGNNGEPIAGLRLLSKPYRRDDLARTVREILDRPDPA